MGHDTPRQATAGGVEKMQREMRAAGVRARAVRRERVDMDAGFIRRVR